MELREREGVSYKENNRCCGKERRGSGEVGRNWGEGGCEGDGK